MYSIACSDSTVRTVNVHEGGVEVQKMVKVGEDSILYHDIQD